MVSLEIICKRIIKLNLYSFISIGISAIIYFAYMIIGAFGIQQNKAICIGY